MMDSKWSGAVWRGAPRFATAAVVLTALSLVLTPATVAAQAPPAASCEGETTVVLVDTSADTDLSAAYLLAEVLRTGCLVDAGPRTDSELPAGSAALLATAGLRFGYVVGGPAAVPASKLTAALVWRRAAGADRWATLRAVAAAAADPTTLPRAEPADTAPTDAGAVAEPRYIAVAAGDFHTCGIQADGTLLCWGSSDANGRGPSPPPGKFTQVSGGHDHACGLRADGTVACWGFDHWGQVSPPAGRFTQVSAGGEHTCGVRVDGTVACWGSNQSRRQWPPAGEFKEVSAGGFQTCGLRTNGAVACWGSDYYGQVSDAPSGTFTQVSVGTWHACGVRADGAVVCWGNDEWGLVSDVPSGSFTQVSAAGFQTCAVRVSGRIVCWGSDNDQWFETFTGQSSSPQGKFTQVSAGAGHTCGLRTDATLACWGDDKFGQVSLALRQIVAVYAIPDGVSAVRARTQDIADAIKAAQSWFRSQTGGRHPAFARHGDRIDVRTVRLDPAPPNEKRGEANARILRETRSALGLRGWEFVSVWLEGELDGPGGPACAWAGHDAYVMVPIWNCGTNVPESGTSWPDGGSWLIAHELTHLLGAAPDCAPNIHDDAAHVTDDPRDIIYRGNQGPPASGDYVLDVGRDDYFGHGRDDCYDISDSPLLRIE
ncbi:MAG: hypothetical protein F4091_15595 [Acidimicrobiales bacterium]|nr:hypothetical protein [Acidimicrobiales bacterium]MYD82105.1 hypothetical protein [Acidimicrobiales bacterium]MYJ47228.1 hypothetical protein [Acidimicrobiales bacterium]MYJ66870.1 hypothetical protein [Acidimicrobiales bacterium]